MGRFACALLAALAPAGAMPAQPALVANGGFESGAPDLGPRPTDFGRWQGDRVAYVGPIGGVSPFEGGRMLQFVNAEFVPGTSDGSQYWQNVDLSGSAALIASGRAVLDASAAFNRVTGNAQTDTEFNLVVRARSGTPSAFSDVGEALATLLADGDPATWQTVRVGPFLLPQGTTHVQLEINAVENVFNNLTNPEFDGHFADAVFVAVAAVPEPSGFVLAGLATCGWLARRRGAAGPDRTAAVPS